MSALPPALTKLQNDFVELFSAVREGRVTRDQAPAAIAAIAATDAHGSVWRPSVQSAPAEGRWYWIRQAPGGEPEHTDPAEFAVTAPAAVPAGVPVGVGVGGWSSAPAGVGVSPAMSPPDVGLAAPVAPTQPEPAPTMASPPSPPSPPAATPGVPAAVGGTPSWLEGQNLNDGAADEPDGAPTWVSQQGSRLPDGATRALDVARAYGSKVVAGIIVLALLSWTVSSRGDEPAPEAGPAAIAARGEPAPVEPWACNPATTTTVPVDVAPLLGCLEVLGAAAPLSTVVGDVPTVIGDAPASTVSITASVNTIAGAYGIDVTADLGADRPANRGDLAVAAATLLPAIAATGPEPADVAEAGEGQVDAVRRLGTIGAVTVGAAAYGFSEPATTNDVIRVLGRLVESFGDPTAVPAPAGDPAGEPLPEAAPDAPAEPAMEMAPAPDVVAALISALASNDPAVAAAAVATPGSPGRAAFETARHQGLDGTTVAVVPEAPAAAAGEGSAQVVLTATDATSGEVVARAPMTLLFDGQAWKFQAWPTWQPVE